MRKKHCICSSFILFFSFVLLASNHSALKYLNFIPVTVYQMCFDAKRLDDRVYSVFLNLDI